MDVKTAFLNSELEETVYMEIPEGVELPAAKPPRPEYTQRIVCRLQKSIYGLKQSRRAWYGRINEFFSSNGLSEVMQTTVYSSTTINGSLYFCMLMIWCSLVLLKVQLIGCESNYMGKNITLRSVRSVRLTHLTLER